MRVVGCCVVVGILGCGWGLVRSRLRFEWRFFLGVVVLGCAVVSLVFAIGCCWIDLGILGWRVFWGARGLRSLVGVYLAFIFIIIFKGGGRGIVFNLF